MKFIRGAFWGIVIGGNAFAALLIVTLLFNYSGVLYWLWDTTYSVWYLLAVSAIVGVSFVAYSTWKRNTKKVRFVYKNESPRDNWGRRVLITRVPSLSLSVKGFKGREGKKWKIS